MKGVTRLSRRESRCDIAVSHGCPDPTRPDPVLLPDVACGVSGTDRIRSNGDLRAFGFGFQR